jgi:hypothetical protein
LDTAEFVTIYDSVRPQAGAFHMAQLTKVRSVMIAVVCCKTACLRLSR